MTLDIPEVAENGASVPVTIIVDSPMSDADYVTDIMIVSEGNPQPGVATFQFSPLSGVAEVTTRVRLATTQTLHVLAKTSTGAVHAASTKVSVTVSGCVN
jgi:sulfur-oxidizing protein SoxY